MRRLSTVASKELHWENQALVKVKSEEGLSEEESNTKGGYVDMSVASTNDITSEYTIVNI
jgi:hypothetical protein